ncbi:flavodoxin family protein [Chromobacterium subtsugae]|uniref:Flavoprotein WrbA n=1 Tax=Chromobacterium subtsugae TaxID=251747 RepID=A0ABS7FJI8_9NEIS|nr:MULTISPECIES: flavodoxin family protein [Chromobacterium]KUM02879.1 flavodoxin [Chromobacterium subtsugae]KZE84096.1 flavodoxin [Chromobacterium sp. F49]MBW7568618.1 flavodoxin family protein [Chromobacterium subtsugae]MBW8290204.1 flavodoxin family protein [Chromobacterium subtsugae]OBU86042.1 flavodoxin [Chromobacterium subtsugae]
MAHTLIVYFSAEGSTHQLACAIRDGAAAYGGASLLRLEPRHIVDGRYAPPAMAASAESLRRADAVIFGSPTYMGGPAAQFKAFADAGSAYWRGQPWTDKVAAGFTIGSSLNGDQQGTLSYFATLAAQHGMLWCGLDLPGGKHIDDLNRLGCQLGLCAHSADGSLHPADLATARHLGARAARVADRLRRNALLEENAP